MALYHPLYLLQLLKSLLTSQLFAVLASEERGQPYNNLVAFAVTDDLKSIIFATDRRTRKYSNIVANENVALLIDSRTNQLSDLTEAVALEAMGSAKESKGEERINLESLYLTKHPYLREFVERSDIALLRVTVHEYVIASFNRTQRVPIR